MDEIQKKTLKKKEEINHTNQNKKRTSFKTINHPLLKPDLLRKRRYQVDIFATTSQPNVNCLVVIPTGLGKTVIALLLTIHRLTEYPESKIFFMAPTRPLVEQHRRSFEALTNIDPDELILLTGRTPPAKRQKIYSEGKVFFLTPQVLQNDLIGNRINLTNSSLMIFDEAHRAVGDYAYCYIAQKYMQQSKLPKILAITASPGKDREKISEVMENLYLNAVEIRTEYDPDVRPYIQEVETEWVSIEMTDEMRELHTQLRTLEKMIYSILFEHQLVETVNPDKISRKEVLIAGKKIDSLILQNKNSPDLPQYLYLKKNYANLIRLTHMSELLETQGVHALKAYLDKNIQEITDFKASKSQIELFQSPEMLSIQQLVEKHQSGGIDHPKLAKLMIILREQFENNPDSRILVFCQFRDTIDHLVEEVNKNELIRASRFVGQQKKGKKKGMSQKDQIGLLDEFRAGTINTLIATSVAEEGLDISECDMVIFYDVVPSEIRAIQRRGRTGRNRSGKVIIFKTAGTREDGYFWAEKRREKEMKRILKELQREYRRKNLSNKNKSNNKITIKNGINKKLNILDKFGNIEGKDQNKNNDNYNNRTGNTTTDSTTNDKNKNKLIQQNKIQQNGQMQLSMFLDNKNKEREEDITHFTELDIPKNLPEIKKDFIETAQFLGHQRPFILVDNRETQSAVARHLSTLLAEIRLEQLPIGDYIISPRCGIERKSTDDLLSSIKDGRIFKELNHLRTQFDIPILIIEGNLNKIVSMPKNAILGLISSLTLNMNVRILQTESARETAELILSLAKKEQEEKKSKYFSVRFGKLPERISDQLEYLISGLPGINRERAESLLREFETLEAIFTATEKELKQAPNIGPVLAKQIRKLATSRYLKDD